MTVNEYKDWIVRFYANHNDVPAGHIDGEIQKELIRCKDCAHHKDKRCTVWRERAVIVECYTADDGYCYLAERKEE